MAYIDGNPTTKKMLKDWVTAGKDVTAFSPGPFGQPPENGEISVEGPHYPKPHTWYARVEIRDGRVVKVR
jgi:hypothetical protein